MSDSPSDNVFRIQNALAYTCIRFYFRKEMRSLTDDCSCTGGNDKLNDVVSRRHTPMIFSLSGIKCGRTKITMAARRRNTPETLISLISLMSIPCSRGRNIGLITGRTMILINLRAPTLLHISYFIIVSRLELHLAEDCNNFAIILAISFRGYSD